MARNPDIARPNDTHRADIDALAQALVSPFGTAHGELSEAMSDAVARGAILFEVVAGVPHEDFGARVTLDLEHAKPEVVDALALGPLPRGRPRWLGLRVGADGGLRIKGYYTPDHTTDVLTVPPAFPSELDPVMVAQDSDVREVYYVARESYEWGEFATACLAPVGGALGEFEPEPRPAHRGFGVSLKWKANTLSSVTVFAHRASLPRDAEIPQLWMRGMSVEDGSAYRMYRAAVKAVGPPVSDWHSLLCWTRDVERGWTRAASLRIPTLGRDRVASGS